MKVIWDMFKKRLNFCNQSFYWCTYNVVHAYPHSRYSSLVAMQHSQCFFKFWKDSWNTLFGVVHRCSYFSGYPLLFQNDVFSRSPSVLGTGNSLLGLCLESSVVGQNIHTVFHPIITDKERCMSWCSNML